MYKHRVCRSQDHHAFYANSEYLSISQNFNCRVISINLHNARYEDWKCAECCQGDRCNYYVTVRNGYNLTENNFHMLLQLGSSSVRTSWLVLVTSLATGIILTAAQLGA